MSSDQEDKQDWQYSGPEYTKAQKETAKLPYYSPNIDKYLVPNIQRLLKDYSNVPLDQQSRHVHEIRDRAWAIRTYPCTGLGVWLLPYVAWSPAYQTILEKLKKGGCFLDIGCFLGCDLRQLVFDGAPSDRMFGVDVVSHWEVGFDLFRDRDTFKATFIEADLMAVDDKGNPLNAELRKLDGQVDIISISAVLHQWDRETQVEASKKLVKFSKVGSMVIGHQIGGVDAGETQRLGTKQWRHNPESFKEMWRVVGSDTGTEWKTQAWLRTFEDMNWDPADSKFLGPDVRVIDFVVTRVR